MRPKCPICDTCFSQEHLDSRAVMLGNCRHVFCSLCFRRTVQSAYPYCPYRCDMQRKLRAQDGLVIEMTLKKRDKARDGKVAVKKRQAELANARESSKKTYKQLRAEVSVLKGLIRNQEVVIASRTKYCASQAAKTEELREQVIKRQDELCKTQDHLLQEEERARDEAVSSVRPGVSVVARMARRGSR
ncbi:hypothetical protein BV20DRAFT_920451, partial [Pilatotrama ljubarskyi]